MVNVLEDWNFLGVEICQIRRICQEFLRQIPIFMSAIVAEPRMKICLCFGAEMKTFFHPILIYFSNAHPI